MVARRTGATSGSTVVVLLVALSRQEAAIRVPQWLSCPGPLRHRLSTRRRRQPRRFAAAHSGESPRSQARGSCRCTKWPARSRTDAEACRWETSNRRGRSATRAPTRASSGQTQTKRRSAAETGREDTSETVCKPSSVPRQARGRSSIYDAGCPTSLAADPRAERRTPVEPTSDCSPIWPCSR